MKKQKHRHKPTKKLADGMRLFQHPFADLDPEIVKKALLQMAARDGAEFPKLVEIILQLFREKYPPHILSVLASYGLFTGISKTGGERYLMPRIEQHHVEVLQALTLMLPEKEWGGAPARAPDIQKAIDTIRELADAFHRRRFTVMEKEPDVQAKAVLFLQERLRLHTQAVRNWGSYSQVVCISTELYAPLDAAFQKKFGFSASNLITTARNLVGLLESRTTERFRWLTRVFREHNIRKIVRAYYKYHPYAEGDPEAFMKLIPPGASREQVLAMLLSHADLLLIENMRFTAEDIASESGLSLEITKHVLEALSLLPGHLERENPEHLFMGNPIWTAPIILLDQGYYCPIPQSIFSQIHGIMHRLAMCADILVSLEARRAQYLEKKVGELLISNLPSSMVLNGTKWKIGEVEYETDHIVLIDTTVVIVEDKSAALTGPGLRGAPDRARRHVQDLIVDPSEQSARLEGLIWRSKKGDADAVRSLSPFGIDFGSVERVVRVSVTLDDFNILSSAELDLKRAGWISNELALAPTMSIADFESVIDILRRPAFLLHYFAERQRVQKDGHIFADEWDFLGCYLETGLNLGNLEEQNVSLALTGMSAPIDRYYSSRDAGIAIERPRPKLTRYMASLVEEVERKAFPHWTVVTTDLLRCAVYEEQRRLDKLLAELKIKVERNWRDPSHECSLIVGSHALQDTAVIFFAYPPQLASQRRERAEDLAAQIFDNGDYIRCLMICRNTARWGDPYTAVFILHRTEDESRAADDSPKSLP